MTGTEGNEYLDRPAREALVADLLQVHPNAAVAAVDDVGLFVPAPAGLETERRPLMGGRGSMDLVTKRDVVPMLHAWEHCQQTGWGQVVTELKSGGQGTFHFVDVRERYGSRVVILVRDPRSGRRDEDLQVDAGPVLPRHAVTLRDELAYFVGIDDAATRMLGWTLEDLEGVAGLDLIHPDDQDRAVGNWMQMLSEPSVPHRWRGRHRCRDGSWLWIEFTTHNGLATHGHVRSELYDISGEMAAVEELEQRRQEAVAANWAKDEFISRTSHELRNPLTAIIGFAQLLEESPDLDADDLGSARHIVSAGHHLLALIDDLLDISKIETGHLQVDVEPTSVSEAMDQAAAFVSGVAGARAIPLAIRHPHEELTVHADSQRLTQVLINLLSNAVKYNREDGRVEMTSERNDGAVRIAVADTGQGIPPEGLERLFEPFERLGAAGGDVEGSGIGLALTKHLVEAMGGTIGVESEPGTGSTFWVDLVPAPHPSPSRAGSPRGAG